jgi:pimeloyl-ACP methyl ester carboxylesterase
VRSAGDLGNTPLLILHHAPGSSALYDSLVQAMSPALALDLPGHGESDPLPGNPQELATWVETVERLLQRMHIQDVRIYGHNGGAAVAVELAHRLGRRVRGIALDAPSFLNDEDRARLPSHYAPPVNPVWDGSHWLRAWHHLRDAELWWPWFDRRHHAARKTAPRIDPHALTLRVREAMKQPASYAPAWEASLSYRWRERLAALDLPVLRMAAPQDVFSHLMPAMPIEDTAAARAHALKHWFAERR